MEVLMKYSIMGIALAGIAIWGMISIRRDIKQTKFRAEQAKAKERKLDKMLNSQEVRELRLVQGVGQAKKHRRKSRRSA